MSIQFANKPVYVRTATQIAPIPSAPVPQFIVAFVTLKGPKFSMDGVKANLISVNGATNVSL